MPFFEYDFKERKEYNIMTNEEDGQALGQYVCKVLSTDYRKLAHCVASLLNEHYIKHLPYPDAEVSAILTDVFEGLVWEESDKRVLALKNIYAATQDNSSDIKDIILRLYDSIEDCYYCDILKDFKVIIVLQAYLEESVNTPEMLIPENFELFISGVFDDEVVLVGEKHKATVLSSFDTKLDLDIGLFSGSGVREAVKDMFLNLMPHSTDSVSIRPTSLADFVASSIFYLFRNGFRFKRCVNCGRFFIPLSRSDELYCNQPSPQDDSRSCKQYGSDRLWYDKLKQDEAAKLARNIYMAKQMLVKRNPDIAAYSRMFEFFKAERKKWEKAVKDRTKTREEYISWLNFIKSKKSLKEGEVWQALN